MGASEAGVGSGKAGGGSGKAGGGGQKTAGQNPLAISCFGVLFMVVATILFAAIVEVWPAVPSGATAASAATSGKLHAVHLVFGLFVIHVSADTSLLVLVIVAAA